MIKIRNITMKTCISLCFALLIFILITTWRNTYYIMNYWCEETVSVRHIKYYGDISIDYFTGEVMEFKNDKAKEDEEYEYDFYYSIIRGSSRSLHGYWNIHALSIK